eukprot:TRINITY_DN5778_c0_g1_i2.p1 TRINITY_DN5778_c0_g1~~TRINITY_DN5778_c0_g1_i2.p1  ORF type:complete len:958 (-),score=123.86 TRINITY_DN5778_c0_g1_i2:557-3430(-)
MERSKPSPGPPSCAAAAIVAALASGSVKPVPQTVAALDPSPDTHIRSRTPSTPISNPPLPQGLTYNHNYAHSHNHNSTHSHNHSHNHTLHHTQQIQQIAHTNAQYPTPNRSHASFSPAKRPHVDREDTPLSAEFSSWPMPLGMDNLSEGLDAPFIPSRDMRWQQAADSIPTSDMGASLTSPSPGLMKDTFSRDDGMAGDNKSSERYLWSGINTCSVCFSWDAEQQLHCPVCFPSFDPPAPQAASLYDMHNQSGLGSTQALSLTGLSPSPNAHDPATTTGLSFSTLSHEQMNPVKDSTAYSSTTPLFSMSDFPAPTPPHQPQEQSQTPYPEKQDRCLKDTETDSTTSVTHEPPAKESRPDLEVSDPSTWNREMLLSWCLNSQRILPKPQTEYLLFETMKKASVPAVDPSFLSRTASCPSNLASSNMKLSPPAAYPYPIQSPMMKRVQSHQSFGPFAYPPPMPYPVDYGYPFPAPLAPIPATWLAEQEGSAMPKKSDIMHLHDAGDIRVSSTGRPAQYSKNQATKGRAHPYLSPRSQIKSGVSPMRIPKSHSHSNLFRPEVPLQVGHFAPPSMTRPQSLFFNGKPYGDGPHFHLSNGYPLPDHAPFSFADGYSRGSSFDHSQHQTQPPYHHQPDCPASNHDPRALGDGMSRGADFPTQSQFPHNRPHPQMMRTFSAPQGLHSLAMGQYEGVPTVINPGDLHKKPLHPLRHMPAQQAQESRLKSQSPSEGMVSHVSVPQNLPSSADAPSTSIRLSPSTSNQRISPTQASQSPGPDGRSPSATNVTSGSKKTSSQDSPTSKGESSAPKMCAGCRMEKKRIFRYLGTDAPVCNACNQHWRRNVHDCELCKRLFQLGANLCFRGAELPAYRMEKMRNQIREPFSALNQPHPMVVSQEQSSDLPYYPHIDPSNSGDSRYAPQPGSVHVSSISSAQSSGPAAQQSNIIHHQFANSQHQHLRPHPA